MSKSLWLRFPDRHRAEQFAASAGAFYEDSAAFKTLGNFVEVVGHAATNELMRSDTVDAASILQGAEVEAP